MRLQCRGLAESRLARTMSGEITARGCAKSFNTFVGGPEKCGYACQWIPRLSKR